MLKRSLLFCSLLSLGFAVAASSTLRVGSHVLVAGDSPQRAVQLLGKPTHKSHRRGSGRGRRGHRGGVVVVMRPSEQWLYRRGDHVTTLTIIDGHITDIDDRRN